MSSELFARLDGEVESREWRHGQAEMEMLAEIYEGRLPDSFKAFFPKDHPRHLINMVKLAWSDLATDVGRLPEFRGDTLNDTALELKRVGLQEKVAHLHLRNAEPSAAQFMWQLAWALIGFGRAIAIVRPDFDLGGPRLSLKDPRHAYPRAKRQSGNIITELADVIFKYEIPKKTAQSMGLAAKDKRDRFGNQTAQDDSVEVIEYVDDTQWLLVSEGGTVIREEHNLGVVPAYVFQSFSPNQSWGLSLFKDQVSFMVAISRLMSQKLAFADQLVNPMIWVKGHEGKIQIGPNTLNRLSPQGAMGIVSPPQNLQVDQDIAILERFSRILSKNPESRQGEVQNKGQYTSSKTIEQLSEAIDTTIGSYWDIIGVGMSKLMEVCFKMDAKHWPEDTKSVLGEKDATGKVLTYKPEQFADRTFIRADYGFGVGGYQGFLMHLQAKEAKTMPQRQAIEAMPGVSDVDEVMRQIELEGLDEAGMANFQAQAAQGALDQVTWAKVRGRMAEERIPLHEVILEYQQELQAQAAAAQESQQAALTAPPGPGELPPEEGQPAGVAPGVFG